MSQLALLDACVLVPQRLSSLLLTLAEANLFAPRWSEQILAETERALVRKLGVPADLARRRVSLMRSAFPEASVVGFEALEAGLICDQKDRHVLAAAIAGEAETLVTANLKDSPDEACNPHGVYIADPEAFLLELLVADEVTCCRAIRDEAERMRRPPMTPRQLLAGIAGLAPTFANTAYYVLTSDDGPAGDIPAYVAVPLEESPLQAFADAPDLGDPLHVAFAWWIALRNRAEDLDLLHALTYSPTAFAGYAWAEELLEEKSIASRVYYAVEDPTEAVAFVRFVPQVAQSSRAFAPFKVRGARYMALKRRPDGSWCVWGLGTRMVAAREVLDG